MRGSKDDLSKTRLALHVALYERAEAICERDAARAESHLFHQERDAAQADVRVLHAEWRRLRTAVAGELAPLETGDGSYRPLLGRPHSQRANATRRRRRAAR